MPHLGGRNQAILGASPHRSATISPVTDDLHLPLIDSKIVMKSIRLARQSVRLISLTPEDFKQLPKDGARFEALVCHLLQMMGYRVLEKPAVGTEGGRDVLVERVLRDEMGEQCEKVLVQCKHYAGSGRAVGDSDVGVWQNAMARHDAHGYLLVTDTRVTENLSWSFRKFTENETNFPRWAKFWDVDDIILRLNKHPDVRDSFFPQILEKARLATQYGDAISALGAGRWEEALIRFEMLNAEQPGYSDVDYRIGQLRQFITEWKIEGGKEELLTDLVSDPYVTSYLDEAERAGLDATEPLPNTKGTLLERITRQIIERDCQCLQPKQDQKPSAEDVCRWLSYLGLYAVIEDVTSCDAEIAAAVIDEVLTRTQMDQYKPEQVLNWLATTYWFRKTNCGSFEFRDPYVVNVLAAMELKELFPFYAPSGILAVGPASEPVKWEKVIVLLIGMLNSSQIVELIKALLEAGLVQLAIQCVSEIRLMLSPVAFDIIYACMTKLVEERHR